jgi:hypothetical protein
MSNEQTQEQLPEWVVETAIQFYNNYQMGYGNCLALAESIYSRMQEENNKLREALERLVHLHNCEMEGIGSGQPTPAQWYEAVNQASEALINKI